MSNAGSNIGQSQEQLPDLYRLLGLTPLETDATKIQRALLAMQKKAESAQKTDIKFAQRATKVIALGKKNLLEPVRKAAYDRAWNKTFASETLTAPEIRPQNAADSSDVGNTPEVEWDLQELESYLPAEDPRIAFDLGGFLRYSASQPESNPIADYDKLQSFLGGGSATATIAPPRSISAAALMPEYDRQSYIAPEQCGAPEPPVIRQQLPHGGFARQIRRKRTRAVLMSVGGVVVGLTIVSGAAVFWAINNGPKPADQLAHSDKPAKSTKPHVEKLNAPDDVIAPAIPTLTQGSGLPKVAGLDGVVPTTATSEMPTANPNTMEPSAPVPADPNPNPSPPTPAPTVPSTEPMPSATPPESAPGSSTEPVPGTTPEPAPDPILTASEKSAWSKAMKELVKTLGNQDFAAAKKQLAESEALARTQLQRDQLRRMATVAQLTEEYHDFVIDAIADLGPSETIKIGSSLEASFVEGNDTAVTFKIRGRLQTSKLTELQVGVSNAIVDLKMDIAHPKSMARKAAFALVHPKTNDAALKRAREQMTEAAGAGAVEADMVTIFDEDYSL